MSHKVRKTIGIFKRKRLIEEQSIVISQHGSSAIDDGYIRLKDNILFRGEEGLKVVQIESSVAGESKSAMACNLAVSLAFSSKRVLLLDLDFKRPKVAKIFGEALRLGISDYLIGECRLDDIITHTKYGVDIVGKGEAMHNTSFVLGSDKFKQFIEELKGRYDFVLLDCAPVLLSSDYMHVAKLSDGILLAVSSNFVKRTEVRETVKLLKKLPTPIIGSVITMKAPESSNKYDDEEF